jgi:hypothetical protein
MNYDAYIKGNEWFIVAESFDFRKYNRGAYDSKKRLHLEQEAWKGDIPLMLQGRCPFVSDLFLEVSEELVSSEENFSIFDREGITFLELVKEVEERAYSIVRE